MYFCSKEHQLLVRLMHSIAELTLIWVKFQVWPLHRRVCGKERFQWPALMQKEIQEMIETSTKPARGFVGSDSRDSATTWLESLTARFEKEAVWINGQYEAKDVPDVFKVMICPFEYRSSRELNLSQFAVSSQKLLYSKREPSNGSPLDAIEIPGLVELRAQAWRIRFTSTYFDREPTFEESLRLLVQHPFDFLAYLEISLLQDLALDSSPPWWSDLQHRIILLLALICAAPRRGYPSKEYYQVEGYRLGVYLETIRYCKEVIKPLDSDIADYLVSNVVTLLGLPFPEDASRVEAELKSRFGEWVRC